MAIRTSEDIAAIVPKKKSGLSLRGNLSARARVADLILED